MRRWVEQTYWWWMLKTSKVTRIRGMAFVYISAADATPPETIAATLDDALERVSLAQGGFGELVTSHLRFVAAIKAPRSWVAVAARGYVSPFTLTERENAHYLACRLLWAATLTRFSQDAHAHGRTLDFEAVRRASHQAQIRFSEQFPDAGTWVDYLKQHPSGI